MTNGINDAMVAEIDDLVSRAEKAWLALRPAARRWTSSALRPVESMVVPCRAA